jgi:hypothetical protein
MDNQKCRLCGERHPQRGGCPSFQSSKPSRKPTTRPVEKTAAHSTSSERIETPPKPAFDRKTYQREYMRSYLPAWRARKKAQE